MTKLETLHDRAVKTEAKLSAICGEIAAEVQKKIDWCDVSCEYQPSDGFVIATMEPDDTCPANTPLQYFIDTWADHKKYSATDIMYQK